MDEKINKYKNKNIDNKYNINKYTKDVQKRSQWDGLLKILLLLFI